MASETRTGVDTQTDSLPWTTGLAAGLAAGVAMGVLLTVMMRPVIAMAIPALYGLQGLTVGWAAHLFHSAVFGVAFVGLAAWTPVGAYLDTVAGALAEGVAYGVVLWVVAAAVVMPIWLGAVGFPNAPALPNFNPMSLVGHVVYGAVLGGIVAALR